jgi:UDP:flavonoid glycosyltransferase YjiC (YdhE family)
MAAIDRLLNDEALRDKAAEAGRTIRAADGLRVAADAIERLGLGS